MKTGQEARVMAGDDRILAIAVSNLANMDMNNMTAKYVVGPTPFGPNPPLITKASGGGGIVIDTTTPPVGYAAVLRVTLDHEDTMNMTPGWYYHEATVVLQTGAIVTVMIGQLRIDPSLVASAL